MTDLMLYMNAAGCIFFLMHLILRPFEKKYVPPGWRMAVNRINLLLFIIPVPALFSYMRRQLYSSHRGWVRSYDFSGICTPVRIKGDTYILLPRLTAFWTAVFLVWMAVILFLLVRFLIEWKKFGAFRAHFKNCMAQQNASQETLQQHQSESDVMELVRRAQQEMKISRHIRVYVTGAVRSPHVGGIFQPSIYLPSVWDVPGHIYYMAFKHELAHIQNKDLLFHAAAYAAKIIYWYNPLLYLLADEMDHCDELAADDCACRAESKADRKAYGYAVLDLLSDTGTQQYGAVKKFGLNADHKKNLKERMMALKNTKKYRYKPLKLILLSCAVLAALIISTAPALAYDLPATFTDKEKEHSLTDTIWYVENSADDPDDEFETDEHLFVTKNFLDFSRCSTYFIDENSVIFEADGQTYAVCRHEYTSGKSYDHNLRKGGGCSVTVFKSKRCSKCGNIVRLEKITSYTYDVCPH